MRKRTAKTIRFKFDERKAIQAAARMIQQSGGEMNYLALMTLLYLVDREALLRFGRPVIGDKIVAMKHGPVLSRLYEAVAERKRPLPESDWHKFIRRPASYVYTVRFSGVPDLSALSEGEIALIDKVFGAHRNKSEWELVDYTRKLPEWEEPKDSPVPIPYEAILKAANWSKKEIKDLAREAARANILLLNATAMCVSDRLAELEPAICSACSTPERSSRINQRHQA